MDGSAEAGEVANNDRPHGDAVIIAPGTAGF
jgi:hypothetical protein